jgi:hypothetical protein
VVAALRPEPDARSVIQPQASAFRLPGGDFQPLASPDPLDPLVVDQPAGPAQQLGDLAIAVATVLPGQLDDVVRQPCFIVTAPRDPALRRAVLPERRTGAALGNRQRSSNMLDADAASSVSRSLVRQATALSYLAPYLSANASIAASAAARVGAP